MTIENADLPAMPTVTYDHGAAMNGFAVTVTDSPGLTKRETMALAAMQGILSSLTDEDNLSPSELARCAVRNADALLAELERTK